jgi:hypothetical protein
MKFTILTIAAFLGLAVAAPAPMSNFEKRYPNRPDLIPSTESYVLGNPGGPAKNPDLIGSTFEKNTTLFITDSPARFKGRNCTLGYWMNSAEDPRARLTSGTVVQVFSAAISESGSNAVAGYHRDHHMGDLLLSLSDEAVPVDSGPKTVESFPCPEGRKGWEVRANYNGGFQCTYPLCGLYLEAI